MKIGLYSEIARQPIDEAREEIRLSGLATSETDIRKLRHLLAESNEERHKLVTQWDDFFNLSMLRDLMFHVQEHRFTLRQINDCVGELELKFCGFENEDAILNFRKHHGEESNIYDLLLWHEYEESYPRAFAGMYEFWCQKP